MLNSRGNPRHLKTSKEWLNFQKACSFLRFFSFPNRNLEDAVFYDFCPKFNPQKRFFERLHFSLHFKLSNLKKESIRFFQLLSKFQFKKKLDSNKNRIFKVI